MPNEELDKVVDPQKSDAEPVKDNSDAKPIDGFASAEELQKAYKELQRKLGEQGSELGTLRQAVKAKESEDRIAQALEKVSSLAKKDEKPAFDYTAYEAKLAEMMAENPQQATKDLLKTVNAWMVEDRQKAIEVSGSKIKELEAKLSSVIELTETMTDDYRENKDLIEKLRSEGLSVAKAKKVAKEIMSAMPEHRTVSGSGISPTRTIVPMEKKVSAVSEDDIANWKAEGLSDAQVAKLKAKYEALAEAAKEKK